MSHADFDRPSTNPGASPERGAAANPSAGDLPLPVPPPPPPRSSPVPVQTGPSKRPPAEPVGSPAEAITQPGRLPPSGIGSARSGRWRGELEQITLQADQESEPSNETAAAGEGDHASIQSDRVTRDAPPWLVSMVFHLILLLALALISSPAGSSIGNVMLSIGHSDVEAPVELTEFSVSDVSTDGDAETFDEVEPEPVSVFDAAQLSEIESVEPVEVGTGMMVSADQPMFDGRSGAMKKALLAIYGGTPETQQAVKLGLEWLRERQNKRHGNWSMVSGYQDGGLVENKAAATAMALLAFMGDGHTHKGDGEYAEVVDRGIRFLVKMQNRDGFFPRGGGREGKMYAQAQATIAVCELYGMTKDSWLRPFAQRAIDFCTAAQSEAGGWRYQPRNGSDTSVTGWFVMAIKSAQAAGLEVDGYSLLRVEKYLDSVQSYDGAAYAYQRHSDPSPSMTAEGLLCRQYTGWNRDHPPMGRGISALLTDYPFDVDDHDVYYWYYATQVMHHYGGEPWKEWNAVMREELPKLQIKDRPERGSWAPQADQWGNIGGRLYTTCLSLYCLEVYYRHMPLYQTQEN